MAHSPVAGRAVLIIGAGSGIAANPNAEVQRLLTEIEAQARRQGRQEGRQEAPGPQPPGGRSVHRV